MKFLGIDYGTKRIGIAISDEAGEFAFPKAVIAGSADPLIEVVKICAEEEVAGIVIGESLATNGAENTIGEQVAKFKAKLAVLTSLPVFFEREDFSSVEAHRYQTKKGERDDSAAAIILQRFLDKRKGIN